MSKRNSHIVQDQVHQELELKMKCQIIWRLTHIGININTLTLREKLGICKRWQIQARIEKARMNMMMVKAVQQRNQ